MTYYTLQRQRINKHVLDLALTLIYGFYVELTHWSSLSFWNNSNQRLKKLDMTFKYTNINVISKISISLYPIYRKFQYRVIGIYKKTIIIGISIYRNSLVCAVKDSKLAVWELSAC